jgi:hypothetical protein
VQAHALELECLPPCTAVRFFPHASRLADFDFNSSGVRDLPKISTHVDENNGISNKLYAECNNAIAPPRAAKDDRK